MAFAPLGIYSSRVPSPTGLMFVTWANPVQSNSPTAANQSSNKENSTQPQAAAQATALASNVTEVTHAFFQLKNSDPTHTIYIACNVSLHKFGADQKQWQNICTYPMLSTDQMIVCSSKVRSDGEYQVIVKQFEDLEDQENAMRFEETFPTKGPDFQTNIEFTGTCITSVCTKRKLKSRDDIKAPDVTKKDKL